MESILNKGFRILIADDESLIHAQLKRLLSMKFPNGEVKSTDSAVEAFEIMAVWEPHILISDIQMPEMDGLELLKQCKDHFPNVEVILITGGIGEDAPIQALRNGAMDYLRKPINLGELSWTVQKALEKIEMTLQLQAYQEALKIRIKQYEAESLMEQKFDLLGSMAGGIAHDINNFLSPILGYSHMGMQDYEDSEAGEHFSEIYRVALQARDLTKQILAFSRKGADGQIEIFEIGEILKGVVKMLQTTDQPHIRVQLKNINHEMYIKGISSQIYTIFTNLVKNAKQAIGQEVGEVIINVSETQIALSPTSQKLRLRPGPYYKIIVQDNGPGIDPKNLEQIFDPLFTTKGPDKGTGFGLAFVKRVLFEHGGGVDVESEKGVGTTFKVYLPIISDLDFDSIEEGEEKVSPEKYFKSRRILIVDDETSIIKMWKKRFERMEAHVEVANGGFEALEIARNASLPFDLLITDENMPDMRGSDLVKMLRTVSEKFPVIICSGLTPADLFDKLANYQYIFILNKPITIDEMLDAGQNLMAQCQMLSQ